MPLVGEVRLPPNPNGKIENQSLVFWANVTPAFLAIGLTLSTLPAPSSG